MNHEFSKLRPKESQQSQASQFGKTGPAGQEFSTVEDLLRHDSAQTPVPPEVAHRVNESIASEPPPAKSWWKKLIGS